MPLRYWNDTATDPDRKRRRQAEFLIHQACPWTLIREIGVLNAMVQREVEQVLETVPHRPPVRLRPDWYY